MKRIYTLLLLLITAGFSFAQEEEKKTKLKFEKRIEIEAKNGYTGETILNFGENGMILRSKKDDKVDGAYEWQYERYDTDLNKMQTAKILIPKKQYPDESVNSKERNFTIFKSKKGKYTLVSVNAKNLEHTKIEGNLPKKTSIKDMAVNGDYAYFSASVKRDRFIFALNWKTGDQNLIPIEVKGYKSKHLSLESFQLMEKSKDVFLYILAEHKKEIDYFIIRLNAEGEKVGEFMLTEEVGKYIVSVSASEVKQDEFMITGTYSENDRGSSQGLFFGKYAGELQFIKYYSFADLENFLSFLPERKQNRLEKKKKRKEKRGKELKVNYLIADHNIIEIVNSGDYLFLGEAYYPTYRSEQYTTYSNGRAITSYRTVFDGFSYTHAVLARFDKDGNMLWDQIFEMNPWSKPFYVKRFISVKQQTENTIDLVYASGMRIKSKSFDFDGKVIQEEKTNKISTGHEGDKTKRTYSNLDYWYGKYFLAYGYQKIKNKKNDDVKRKRKVFFISKIKY